MTFVNSPQAVANSEKLGWHFNDGIECQYCGTKFLEVYPDERYPNYATGPCPCRGQP